MTNMEPCTFALDHGPVWQGFAHGSKWNGFDNVAVTKETLDAMVAYIRSTARADGVDEDEAVGGMDEIEPMENGLYSLGWGFATTIQ